MTHSGTEIAAIALTLWKEGGTFRRRTTETASRLVSHRTQVISHGFMPRSWSIGLCDARVQETIIHSVRRPGVLPCSPESPGLILCPLG